MVQLEFNNINKATWEIINNPRRISERDYSFLTDFFSKPTKYEFFIKTIEDFRAKILDSWFTDHKFITFHDFIHKYESNPNRYLYANNKPRDKANYLAFKIAQHMVLDDEESSKASQSTV